MRLILIILFLAPTLLLAQEKVGINTTTPKSDLDVRGTDDNDDGGELQLATPSETNFLRFFGGRLGDPNPFIAFTDTDTFHIVSTSEDYSTFKQRLTMYPNGYVGLNNVEPASNLDVRPGLIGPPSVLNIATQDQSHFARLFSGFGGATSASLTWRQGLDFAFGRINPDGSDFALNMLMDAGGNVGIGTYDPAAKLDIEAPGDSSSLLRLGTERPWVFRQYDSGPFSDLVLQAEVNDKAFEIMAPNGNRAASFLTNNGFSKILFSPDNTNALVGIGLENPSAKLHILHNSGFSSPQIELTEDGDDYARIKFTSTSNPGARWTIAGQADTIAANSRLNFYYNGPQGVGDRITIKGDGKVGIGEFNPTARLHVNGDFKVTGLAGSGDRNVIVDANGKFKVGNIGTGGSDSDWVEGTDVVYNSDDNIGLGTSNPASKLTIVSGGSNGTNGSLKMIQPGTPPFNTDAVSMVMDANDIDVNGTLFNTLNIQRNSAGGIEMVEGGGGVGVGTGPSSSIKLVVQGTPIPASGDPETVASSFSIINADGDFSQMIMDGNEISTVDEALFLNRISDHNIVLAQGGGNVGVGIAPNSSKVRIQGPDNNGSIAALEIKSAGSSQTMILDGNEIDVVGGGVPLHLNANSGLPVCVNTLQAATGYALSVAGSIMAEEVRVQLESNWPDYVFDPAYELMPLDQVKESIAANGHLPGIPSAAEVEDEGLQLGEMQRKMMEKIEELTLHMIQLNERLESLEDENAMLKEKLNNK